MARKRIYLDYNLIAYYFDRSNNEFCEKFDLVKDFCDFPYSPAHLEEIAVPIMKQHKSEKPLEAVIQLGSDKLNNISSMTRNVELLPREGRSTILKREMPIDCLKRVIKYYHLNEPAEKNEEDFLIRCKDGDPSGVISNTVSNFPEDFLRNTHFGGKLENKLELDLMCAIEARKARITEFRWPFIGRTHQLLERTLELTFNFLEEIRFKPESVSKSRSRIHDVSHAIYATSADYFVSNDPKLIAKTKVVYNYFNIKTKAISLKEFIDMKHF